MNDAAQPLGIIKSDADLRAVLRARREQLGLSFLALDALAGFADGYSSTLLGVNPGKNFGVMSLGATLGALGIALLAVDDPEQMARIRSRLVKRNAAGAANADGAGINTAPSSALESARGVARDCRVSSARWSRSGNAVTPDH